MKFNLPINNFTAGEWSPKMRARTDTEQYPRACEELTNMLVLMQGGAGFRGGTARSPILDSAAEARLNAQTADGVTLRGLGKMVPYKPYSRLNATMLYIANDTDGLGATVTGGITWYTMPNGVQVTKGANTIVEHWNPQDTWFVQAGDIIFLISKSGLFKPKVFYYNSGTFTYRVDDIDIDYVSTEPWKTIPFGEIQALSPSLSMTPAATTGTNVDLTASVPYFVTGMPGAYVKFCDGTAIAGIGRIVSITSSTVAKIDILMTLPSTVAYGGVGTPDTFWQISAWRDDVGWPRTVAAHQGRILYGGTRTKPDTLWGSRIGNYFDFDEIPSPHTDGPFGFQDGAYLNNNARPFTLTPNSAEASNILALSSAKTLVVNTDRSEIVAYGAQGALGPNDVVFESSTSFGAEPVQPVRVNNFLTFVQAGARKIRDIIFNFNEDQYKSTDLSFTSEHFFLSEFSPLGVRRIQELSKTEGQSSFLWVLAQGQLYAATLDRDYQINAWSRIELGDAGEAAPYILSCAPFFSGRAFESESLHMMVGRTIDGDEILSYEIVTPMWELGNPVNLPGQLIGAEPVYLDCASIVYVSPAGDLALDFDVGTFYANTTVSVVADGAYVGEFLVQGDGHIVLNNPATAIVLGYPYEGTLKTMPIEAGGQIGTPMGRLKRVDEMVIRFWNTLGAKFGKHEAAMEEIPFRLSSQPMDEPPDYFTGDKVVNFPAGYDRETQIIIKQDKPYPMFISGVIPRGVTYD